MAKKTTILRLRDMNQIVNEELEHIPRDRGNLPQQLLRSHYQTTRMRSLGKKGDHESKEDVLKEAITSAKKEYPEFEPEYDSDYFPLTPNDSRRQSSL